MEDRLRELLDLSIADHDRGISYVNFKALRQLLHYILQRLCTHSQTAEGRKEHDGRDVDESLLGEQGSESSGQPSGKQLKLSTSDTREEGVSKCMQCMSQRQGWLERIQELNELTNNLKKDMETSKTQFSQVYESLGMGPKNGELDKSAETAIQSRDSITRSDQETADLWNAVQKLYEAVKYVKQDMQELKMELRENSKKIQDKELTDSVTGAGLSDTSEKMNVPPTLTDSSTAVSDEAPSQISSGAGQHQETLVSLLDVDHLQKMQKSLNARVEHLEGEREHMLEQVNQLKTQLVKTVMVDIDEVYESSNLSEELEKSKDITSGTEQQPLQTTDHGNAVQQLLTEMQNVKQDLLTLRMEQKRTSEGEKQDKELNDNITGTGLSDASAKMNIPPTSRDSSIPVSTEALSQTSSQVDQAPVSSLDVDNIQGLKTRVEHLEGEKENIQDQVNELKTQFVELVSEMESLVISPESSGLGGALDKSAETAAQSKDSTSGSDQQRDLQIADLKKAMQQLNKALQIVKQELQELRTEQKRTAEKEMKSKDLKDSVTGTGLSHTSGKMIVPPTSKDSSTAVSGEAPSQTSSGVGQHPETPEALPDIGHLEAMHKSLKSRVEHLEEERKHILEQVNQLKPQMMEMVIAETMKVYNAEPQVMGTESSGLGGELDTSAEKAIQSTDGTSGSEQKHDLQTADLRNAVQQLVKEVHSVKQEMLALRMEQKKTSEKEEQDRTTMLSSDVQGAIEKLQTEFKKLHGTTRQQMKSGMQEQTHIDHLYKAMKELEAKAEEEIKITNGIKADMHTLETTVFTSTQQLNRMYTDLLSNTTGLEEDYHFITEKIFREMRLNHTGMDHLQKQILNLQKAQTTESDNAAIVKKPVLTRFHCLSCDRPVNLKTPGPNIPLVPAMPGFPVRQQRRTMPPTNFGQSDRSPKEGDSCDFSGQVHNEHQKTIDVKSVETRMLIYPPKKGETVFRKWIPEDSRPPNQHSRQQVSALPSAKENLNVLKEGDCEYNLNHNQLPASVGRKSRQSPYRHQHSETKLICIGTGCFKKEKKWNPDDSLPRA